MSIANLQKKPKADRDRRASGLLILMPSGENSPSRARPFVPNLQSKSFFIYQLPSYIQHPPRSRFVLYKSIISAGCRGRGCAVKWSFGENDNDNTRVGGDELDRAPPRRLRMLLLKHAKARAAFIQKIHPLTS